MKRAVGDNEKKIHSNETMISSRKYILGFIAKLSGPKDWAIDFRMLLFGRIIMYNAKSARVTRVERNQNIK